MKKKKKIKAKPWQIFSYYIMPFILGIITFFGLTKIVESTLKNKLCFLPDIINKLNSEPLISLFLSLIFIAAGYALYWAVYSEGTGKINFNKIKITPKSIIIPLLTVIGFYFLPNIFVFLYDVFVFLHDVCCILIYNEKYKYIYLLLHILCTYSIFGLIYYKDKDFLKITKIHYSYTLFVFTIAIIGLAICSEEHFITVILEHRLRTVFIIWFAFYLPFFGYAELATHDEKYKDFLFRNDISDLSLLVSAIFIICSVIYYGLGDISTKAGNYIGKVLSNLIPKLNSISYVPAILTTLTVIFIGFAIYKTKKQLKD